jgi:RNA polymerase sigma-70 factor, ECF subfamily
MGGSGASSAEIEAIYRERFRAFLFSATALLGDGDLALDVVQDGFALALRRQASFRGEGTLEAWLWRIVLNVARDRLRSRRREDQFGAPETIASTSEPSDDLQTLLLTLPERQRLAIFLRYYADLSYREIAEALGVTSGTVAASLNAAHAALRRNMEEVAR